MQAMPDTQEGVGALSLNPGYSTLPGAEARPISNHEVSFYYDNTKLNHNLGSYRDNIYGDSTSSNIYGNIYCFYGLASLNLFNCVFYSYVLYIIFYRL